MYLPIYLVRDILIPLMKKIEVQMLFIHINKKIHGSSKIFLNMYLSAIYIVNINN